jgi:tRNA-2-methylthio-N6-dimethylallyladenosine synthase
MEGGPIRWVRFLSSHPKDFSPQLIQVMRHHPVLCRHLHLPVQHGSDRILQAMNRRYKRQGYLDLVDRIRDALPDLSFSTDILIGFPGETEEDVDLTLDLMDRVRYQYSYMYHYNPREGTAAYKLPGRIDETLKRQRLGRVIELQKQHTQELLKARIDQRVTVLVEGISRKNADELLGRTERDEMVVFPGSVASIASFGSLTLGSLRGNTFRAKDFSVW